MQPHNNSHSNLPVLPHIGARESGAAQAPAGRVYVENAARCNRQSRECDRVAQRLKKQIPRGHNRRRQDTADAHDRRHQPQVRIAGCGVHCRPLGGVASCPNQIREGFARQNHLRNICSLNRNSARSAAPPSAFGRITRRRSSPSAPASAFAMPIKSCGESGASPQPQFSPSIPSLSVHTAGTGLLLREDAGQRYRARRLQRELLAPRLRRESGGVTPTAQMTRVRGRKRAEVQGSAPRIEEGGKPSTLTLAGGVTLVGQRAARLSERSPAFPRQLAEAIVIVAFKAIDARTFSTGKAHDRNPAH